MELTPEQLVGNGSLIFIGQLEKQMTWLDWSFRLPKKFTVLKWMLDFPFNGS